MIWLGMKPSLVFVEINMGKKNETIWRPLNTWGLVAITVLVVLAMAGSILAIAP